MAMIDPITQSGAQGVAGAIGNLNAEEDRRLQSFLQGQQISAQQQEGEATRQSAEKQTAMQQEGFDKQRAFQGEQAALDREQQGGQFDEEQARLREEAQRNYEVRQLELQATKDAFELQKRMFAWEKQKTAAQLKSEAAALDAVLSQDPELAASFDRTNAQIAALQILQAARLPASQQTTHQMGQTITTQIQAMQTTKGAAESLGQQIFTQTSGEGFTGKKGFLRNYLATSAPSTMGDPDVENALTVLEKVDRAAFFDKANPQYGQAQKAFGVLKAKLPTHNVNLTAFADAVEGALAAASLVNYSTEESGVSSGLGGMSPSSRARRAEAREAPQKQAEMDAYRKQLVAVRDALGATSTRVPSFDGFSNDLGTALLQFTADGHLSEGEWQSFREGYLGGLPDEVAAKVRFDWNTLATTLGVGAAQLGPGQVGDEGGLVPMGGDLQEVLNSLLSERTRLGEAGDRAGMEARRAGIAEALAQMGETP